MKLKIGWWRGWLLAGFCGWVMAASVGAMGADYAVVVSRRTHADREWQRVVEKLRVAHNAAVMVYDSSIEETLPQLREMFPRYTCFVSPPAEATRQFVAQVHRLTRRFNDDPYCDCFWGILTGYDAANALRIASHREPLRVRKVASGTDVALEMCEEGMWFSEGEPGLWVQKKTGGKPEVQHGPADSTVALARSLTEYRADMFVTSGHATERDWQIGYSYRNGSFRCEQGALFGRDLKGEKHAIVSPNPKVYLPVGNCLMGHIDGTNAMALAFMNSGGVNQMIGYTVPSWYGYAGWGCLDYFLQQPGRYTLAEAFFANQAALIYRLQTYFPDLVSAELDANFRPTSPVNVSASARAAGLKAQDATGLLYDRDTVAFYGDPAWEARMAEQPKPFDQTLTCDAGRYVFEIKPNRGTNSFDAVNTNGSQRGGRPFVAWLPHRVRDVKVVEGAEWNPVVGDRFILVPHPGQCDPAKSYRVVFQARPFSPGLAGAPAK